jgi:Lon protease-like protein
MSPFDPGFDDLPPALPIFPLTGVLLLPRGRLPLNIFEPRYLNMVTDALASNRMFGMVQPSTANAEAADGEPALYQTGCAGRITHFEETDDGRFILSLKGVSRFAIVEEFATTRGYRKCTIDWEPFRGDLAPAMALAALVYPWAGGGAWWIAAAMSAGAAPSARMASLTAASSTRAGAMSMVIPAARSMAARAGEAEARTRGAAVMARPRASRARAT